MPTLQNPQHEAFAQARSRTVSLEDAFENAGYSPDRSHACRLAKRDDVSARIAELRAAAEGKEGLSAFLGKRAPSWARE